MHMFTERTQVLLSRDQVERLKRIAARDRRSVGSVIREAVDRYLETVPERRSEAARRITAMELPVADWETMKAEILRGRLGSG
jgi:predicted DNA-binding protein